jgi:HEAT repeat protein
MKRLIAYVTVLLVSTATGLAGASGETVDTYIKQLKDNDPSVRANAAYELSCS